MSFNGASVGPGEVNGDLDLPALLVRDVAGPGDGGQLAQLLLQLHVGGVSNIELVLEMGRSLTKVDGFTRRWKTELVHLDFGLEFLGIQGDGRENLAELGEDGGVVTASTGDGVPSTSAGS